MDLSLRKSRKNVAVLALLSLVASMMLTAGVASAAAATDYNDVDGTEWYSEDVQWALDNGVLSYDETLNPSFRAGDNATRAEFFKMTAAGAGIPEAACDSSLYDDLGADHWGCGWITALSDAGIVSGDSTGNTVRPDDNIVRAEAAKVTVEAYGLTGDGTLGSDVWTDVDAGAWYDDYLGVAYYNCVFQGVGGGSTVLPGTNIVRAEAVAVVHRGATPNQDCMAAMPTGALTVSIDGTTPDPANIPFNGANILYAVYQLKASADEDLHVEELVLTREGLGLPGDFDAVKLYVNGVQKGGERTVNTSENTATFALASSPIEVPAGKSVLVELRADMDGTTAGFNSQSKFCINNPEDVTAYGASSGEMVDVGGSFAACGELMTTTDAEVGTLTYEVIEPSQADIEIGSTDVSIMKLRLEMDTEDVDVERLTLRQSGSADPEDIANPVFYVSGSPLDIPYEWEGDFLTFDLSDDPLFIERGNVKTLDLRVDIVGGLDSSVSFDVYRDWHIEGTGRTYHYGVNVEEGGASDTPVNRNIIGGNIAFSLSANNPIPDDVASGANDHPMMKFNISTAGDSVNVRQLTINVGCAGGGVAANIEDVKIWQSVGEDEWKVVAGPNDIAACATDYTLSDDFYVPGLETIEYMVTADITNDAVTGEQYDVDILGVDDPANTEIEYSDGTPVDEANEVTGTDLDGNVQTVDEPTLDVTLASSPQGKTYVRNTTNRDLAAWDFVASTADDIRVTNVKISCTAATAATGVCDSAFSTLYLYDKDGSTLTELSGPENMDDEDAGFGEGSVEFQLDYVIPAGDSSRILLRGDVQGAAIEDDYEFAIAANADVSAEDSEGSAVTVDVNGGLARTLTVAAMGDLANSGVSDIDTQDRILIGLSEDNDMLKIRFEADELEPWIIKTLYFYENVGNPEQIGNVNVTYKNQAGETVTTSKALVGGVVTFDNLDIYVGSGMSQTIVASVDINEVDTDGGVTETGETIQLIWDDTEWEAVGAASAELLPAPSTTQIDGEVHRVAKSAPYVVKEDVGTTLANASNLDLYEVTLTADEAGDITVKQIGFDLDITDNDAGGELDLSEFRFFKDGVEVSDIANVDIIDGTSADLEVAGPLLGDGAHLVYVMWLDANNIGEDIIEAGTSTTYTLKATVTGVEDSDTVSVAMGYDTAGDYGTVAAGAAGLAVDGGADAYLAWSDYSDQPHSSDADASSADWLDGWLVDGLSSIGSQILSES